MGNGKAKGCKQTTQDQGDAKKNGNAHFFDVRDRYVLGGIHLTNLAFLPNALLKEITATEYKRSITSFYNNHFALADLEEQQVVRFLFESIKNTIRAGGSNQGCTGQPFLLWGGVEEKFLGSCHLILRRVPQPLWEGVHEKYWPNEVTSGASISQEKAN